MKKKSIIVLASVIGFLIWGIAAAYGADFFDSLKNGINEISSAVTGNVNEKNSSQSDHVQGSISITETMKKENCIGKRVGKIKKLFINAGFSNLKFIKKETNIQSDEKIVYDILINHNNYSVGDVFSSDATVEISYWIYSDAYRDTSSDYSTGGEEPPLIDESQQQSQEVNQPDSQNNTSGDGIRPEVKECLDAYEALMNEYCDFMESYDENDFSAMADYLIMMAKYEEAINRLDELDEEDLNDAEMNYYMQVTLRIEARLLETVDKM